MLSVHSVSKKYGKTQALSFVDLDLTKGIYGLLGPNGSGKTTLFRCITGIETVDTGSIEKPKTLGYLPQRFGAYKHLSVFEMLEYYAALKEIPKNRQKESIESAVEAVNLTDQMRKRAGNLSGGMQRRLGIAAAILGDPEWVLFDEPTTGLDPEERMRFKIVLGKLRQKGVSCIISTHIVEDVETSCDRIIVLNHGVVAKQCSSRELARLAEKKVYLLSADEQDKLCEPYYLVNSSLRDEKECLRILSPVPQTAEETEPTMEDGYLCCIHGML